MVVEEFIGRRWLTEQHDHLPRVRPASVLLCHVLEKRDAERLSFLFLPRDSASSWPECVSFSILQLIPSNPGPNEPRYASPPPLFRGKRSAVPEAIDQSLAR